MGVKEPKIREGHYCGELTVYEQENILSTQKQSVIPKLKHMIFDFPKTLVEEADALNISVLQLLRNKKEDCKKYRGELRDYQTVGAGFLWLSPFSVLGDGVGIGKTVEISALINMLRMMGQMNRVLIAVDPTAVTQTINEIKRFTGMRVLELPSLAAKMSKVIDTTDMKDIDIIVTKHTAIKSDVFFDWLKYNVYYEPGTGKKRNNLYDVFILDESSVVKTPDTIQYTYTKDVVEMAKRAHFLNATVFETHILDIYHQMNMLIPTAIPQVSDMKKEFCVYERGSFYKTIKGERKRFMKFDLVGYRNEELFKERLKLFYFARSIQDVGLQGNNKYMVCEIMPSEKQLRAMKKGYRSGEVLNDPSLIPELKLPTSEDNVPKLKRAISLCTQDFAQSTILIYCFHKNTQYVMKALLEKEGKRVGIINSDTKDKERVLLMDQFNNGELDILITNSKRSLNLYSGNVCIMYSLEGNPAKMEQIRGRIDRHVDDKERVFVLMYYIHSPEYELFFSKAVSRNQAARDFTIDSKSAVDFFAAAVEEGNYL